MWKLIRAGICALPLIVNADEIYRWQDESGRVHFSDQPHPQAERLEMEVNPQDKAQRALHQQVQKEMQGTVKQLRQNRLEVERAQTAEKRRLKRQQSAQQAACGRAEERLNAELARWERQRRQGYKQAQKRQHLAKKEQLELRVDSACRT